MKIFTTRPFMRRLRHLREAYPHVVSDIAPLVAQLKAGENPGDRLQGVGGRRIYKARVANRDAQSGKSGGYRIVYYLVDKDSRLLITIYSKSAQEDISRDELLNIVTEWEAQKKGV